jgi:hypothetical protein
MLPRATASFGTVGVTSNSTLNEIVEARECPPSVDGLELREDGVRVAPSESGPVDGRPGGHFQGLVWPFTDMHALRMKHEPDMSGLVKTMSEATGFAQTHNMPKVVAALKVLAGLATASGAPGVSPSPTFRSSP